MVRRFAYCGNGKIHPVWSQKEIGFLKEHYADEPTSKLSKKLSRSASSIRHKASRLKIFKNHYQLHEFKLTDIERGYLAGIIDGEGTIRLHRERGIKSNDWGDFLPK